MGVSPSMVGGQAGGAHTVCAASAADDAANFKFLTRECIEPFNCIGSTDIGIDPKKKRPSALLRDFLAVKYDASE